MIQADHIVFTLDSDIDRSTLASCIKFLDRQNLVRLSNLEKVGREVSVCVTQMEEEGSHGISTQCLIIIVVLSPPQTVFVIC